jgi:hypothetical protein
MFFNPIAARSLCIALLAACAFLSGCGGSQKLLVVKEYKKVAVVQIASNKTIEWADKEKQESTGGQVQSTVKFFKALSSGKDVSAAMTEANHNAQSALDSCANGIFATIAQSGAVPIMAADQVTANSTFQALIDDRNKSSSKISAPNYKLISTDDAKKAEICKALNAEAIMLVDITFSKDIYNGVGASGQAKGGADVIVSLVDSNGETLWWDSDFENSENSTGMISGVYKYEEMDKLCAQAAEAATAKAMKDLQAKLAKAAKN